MKKYNYRRAITDDIKDWIVNDTDLMEESLSPEDTEIANWIYDEVFSEDSITGNGAYYYGTEEFCSECLSDNFDLLYEAAREYCIDDNINILIDHYRDKDLARYFDCTIRCYLLGECIEKALEELENDSKRFN